MGGRGFVCPTNLLSAKIPNSLTLFFLYKSMRFDYTNLDIVANYNIFVVLHFNFFQKND